MRYTVQATVVRTAPDGWRVSSQVPTFFLDSDVTGIADVGADNAGCVHAAHVALAVLDPLNLRVATGLVFHVAVADEHANFAAFDSDKDTSDARNAVDAAKCLAYDVCGGR